MLIRNLIYLLLIVLVTATGCSSSSGQTPTATTESVSPTPAPPAEPTATPESSGQPVETESPPDASPASALTVEAADAIQSYRFRIATKSESVRGEDVVEIEGAVVKSPPAEQIGATFQQGDRIQRLEMLLVGGIRYMRTGDTWMQTPDTLINFDELTLITPRAVVGLLGQMERVAVEAIAGRPAIHYRGGKDLIPAFGGPGDQLDVSQIEFAQLDLWVDEAEHVITRLMLETSDSETENLTRVTVIFEYYELNGDIVIEAPVATTPEVTEETAATEPARTELGRLVGFNLLVPTGTTVEGIVGANILVATTPYTFDEAQHFVEQNMVSNGYTLITKIRPANDQVAYLFQNGPKVINVTVMSAGSQETRIQFAASE